MKEEKDTDGTPPRNTEVVYLSEPEHPEMYTSEESAVFQPWKVTLKIQLNEQEPDNLFDYEIFLRAPSPKEAQWFSYKAFLYMEHTLTGIPADTYPQPSADTQSSAKAITEKEWNDALEEANKHQIHYIGMRENPSLFRFNRDKLSDAQKKSLIAEVGADLRPNPAEVFLMNKMLRMKKGTH